VATPESRALADQQVEVHLSSAAQSKGTECTRSDIDSIHPQRMLTRVYGRKRHEEAKQSKSIYRPPFTRPNGQTQAAGKGETKGRFKIQDFESGTSLRETEGE
jgi:hypothetical protein